jgi:hypothetical protein
MTKEREDDVDRRLRALPDAALPAALAARVHARARAAFDGEAPGPGRPFAGIATATAVVSAIAIYLAWAVQFLSALARS